MTMLTVCQSSRDQIISLRFVSSPSSQKEEKANMRRLVGAKDKRYKLTIFHMV
jgi:hypothetical protein